MVLKKVAGILPPGSRVLVTGATGAVGPLLVSRLLAEGYSVRTFSLDKPRCRDMEGVEAHIGEISDFHSVRTVMKGIDAVVHMAALLHIVNPSESLAKDYERINVGGTANVIKAAIEEGVKRVLLFSTIAVYGRSGEGVLSEKSNLVPDSLYGRTKREAEKIVMEVMNSDGQPMGVALRFGAVYGPAMKGNYLRLLNALSKSRFANIGNGRNRRTLISVWDAADAAVLALSHPDAAGKIFNVSDGKYHTTKEIIAAVCNALGRKVPRLSLPLWMVLGAAKVIDGIAALLGLGSIHLKATVLKYTEDTAIDCSQFQRELGFSPKYDLVSGWDATVKEMKRSGLL